MIVEPNYNEPVAIEDKILFLYLLVKMPDQKLTTIESMKMVFFVKAEAYFQKKFLFRAQFFRGDKGPVAQHVYDLRREFASEQVGRVELKPGHSCDTEYLAIDPGAAPILGWIESYAFNNPWAFDLVDVVVKKYGRLTWRERQKAIYALKINGRTIREYAPKEIIAMPAREDWTIFIIPEKSHLLLKQLMISDKRQEIEKKRDRDFCYLVTLPLLREDWDSEGDKKAWQPPVKT
ncbi:MAG: hypothetical protein RBG13Loki_0610 [Promethearchaeota archaeon CR_4]|nr:MAG: hypothetical protein RBG13Loki_0610 [Candidatus Lokiarchaeota archaeon CR_4]